MVKSLSDLEKLLSVLRSQGVSVFKFDGLELVLEAVPVTVEAPEPQSSRKPVWRNFSDEEVEVLGAG